MLQYRFANPDLRIEALTNRAYRNRDPHTQSDNQRLEFLGDAVLELVCSQYLFERYPEAQEGALTVMRTRLTDEDALAGVARRLQLGPLLRLDAGQEHQGARENNSILADAVEALLGAIFLDGGLEVVSSLFATTFAPELEAIQDFDVRQPSRWKGNPKGQLQQFAAARFHANPQYTLLSREGPEHAPTFSVQVRISPTLEATASGPNKQKAEVAAAAALLDILEKQNAQESQPTLPPPQKP